MSGFTDTVEIHDYENKRMKVTAAHMQIPRMYMPFGISGFTPEIGQTKWNIDFAMKGWDETDNYVKKFYDTLRSIEGKVIDAVTAQSESIFGTPIPRDDIQKMFYSNIKESEDREPKFRVKVDTLPDGKIKPHIFDEQNQNITADAKNGLYARNSGVAMVEVCGVYFLNRKFGLTWKLHQLKVFSPQHLKGFQFLAIDKK